MTVRIEAKSNVRQTLGPPLRLWLVRHGLTAWNIEGRWQGWSDPPLAEEGREQARRLRPRLEGRAFDVAAASDLSRALETGQLAGLTPTLEPRLREVNFGEFEGRLTRENAEHPEFHPWLSDPVNRRTPGGESYLDLRTRALGWVDELPEAGEVVAFAHGGTVQALVTGLIGIEPMAAHRLWTLNILHASITVISRHPTPTGPAWTLERLNDTAHLE